MVKFSWVALGDSYTAGVIEAAGDLLATPPDGRWQTSLSYPMIIARNLERVDLTNVSTANADSYTVFSDNQSLYDRYYLCDISNPVESLGVLLPQIDVVEPYPPKDVITVGVGFADIDFGDILTTCMALGKDSGNKGAPGKSKLAESIPKRLRRLQHEYRDMLHALGPRTRIAGRIVTVGCPTIIPEDLGSYHYDDALTFSTITVDDLAWLRTDVLEPLNAVIQEVSTDFGATYVDLYATSKGHSVCDRAKGENWVEGFLSSAEPRKPGLWLPNAKGHEHAAACVQKAILDVVR
jgi:GDSL-like Lipase/Acylhydrolase family